LYIQWKIQCEHYNQKQKDLAANKVKIFTVLMQQCSPSVTSKVEVSKGHEKAKKNYECDWLIRIIKSVCHSFEQSENRFMALVKAKADLFQCKQGQNQSTHDYGVHYGPLRDALSNAFGLGRDEYPTSLVDAYKLLLTRKGTTTQPNDRSQKHKKQTSFVFEICGR
jgi:hypothetical protein